MFKKISIVGGGRISRLIIKRLLNTYKDIEILVSTRTQKSASLLTKEFPVKTTTDNKEVVEFSDIIFLCIRPENIEEFLNQIKGVYLKNKIFISLLVIFEPEELKNLLRADKVCIFHPTTYLHYCEEDFLKSFIIFSKVFSQKEKETIKNFLSKAFGNIQEEGNLNSLKEKIFLYGNFPAYLLTFLKKLILFLTEKLKISEKEANKLIKEALNLSTEDMKRIEKLIATPGGITERGITAIETILEELLYSLEGNTFLKIDKARQRYGRF